MGEFRFGQDLVRALLREQHPDLAGRGQTELGTGGLGRTRTRRGRDLTARAPRQGQLGMDTGRRGPSLRT